MIIKQSLVWAIKILQKNKISSPALDAEILLSSAIKKPKEFLYTHSEKKLTAVQLAKFQKLIARRTKHEPVAYILGRKFFYGLDFFVDKNVLIPRPETEILVEEVLKIAEQSPHPSLSPLGRRSSLSPLPSGERIKVRGNQPLAIIDIGTGSGCIAISLARHLPGAKIFATEISSGAIKMAKKNARHHHARVTFLRGNLLDPVLSQLARGKPRYSKLIITTNLPYLTTRQWQKTQPEIKEYEPRVALDGGPDGLKHYRQLLQQIKLPVTRYPLPVTSIFEIDPSQTKRITKIIKHDFPAAKIQIKKDLAGRDRLVIIDIGY